MNSLIQVERKGHVAHVRLNRPDKHNALNWELFTGLVELSAELAADASLRAVVISGNGPSFCSGLDYPEMASHPVAFKEGFNTVEGAEGNVFQMAAWCWKRLPVPVIAAVHGACFGGGIQIALGADLRIARPDARLSVMEIKWGLVPDMSGTLSLRELVRVDVAKELTYTGRIVSGEEAAGLGLVTRLADDPVAEALDMADAIAAKNPEAIRLGKKLIDENWNEPDAAAALGREKAEQMKILQSPNQVEAARSALAKVPANFADSRF